MERLVRAEFLKLAKSLDYKILLICVCGLSILIDSFVLMADTELTISDGYSAYLAALMDNQTYMIFAMIFASIFVCNEFANRNFGMGLFSGCSRRSILLSKAVVYLVGLMPIVFAEPLVIGIMMSIREGFGTASVWTWGELIQVTCLFIVGCMAIGSFCFMLAVLIKNVAGTIGATLGILLSLELVMVFPRMVSLAKFTFLYQMSLLPQPESIGMYMAVMIGTIAATLGVSVAVFQRMELK